MRSRTWMIFLFFGCMSLMAALYVLASHLLMPANMLSIEVSPEIYHDLIFKWFLAGVGIGMTLMFFLIETWVWKNWHSWNKFCCEHHERVYRSQMGIGPKMLRRI